MNDASQREDDIHRTEALYRFGAALHPRDDFERNLYREWHARDASGQTGPIFGGSSHLHGLTPDQMRQLAEADVQAQAEYAAEHREPHTKPYRQPQWELEPELEAGF
jgi:hypothetical protein